LCSRSGRAEALQARLAALGANVVVARCDVSRREEVAALLGSISPAHPLSAVIHTSVALADGVLSSLGQPQLATAFGPSSRGAWHLHELTQAQELQAFILFSSMTGVVGGAGMSNYAAANSFLDSLAQYRRARGLVGSSLAWGLWGLQTGLAGNLGESEVRRMTRGGIAPLSLRRGWRCSIRR